MVRIAFRQADGQEQSVEAEAGVSVMEAAITGGIEGIDADCGGQLSCATCHVYIPVEWQAKLPTMTSDENELLDFAPGRDERSRLCCQILCTVELEGMVVDVPESQH
jgi:2Fe-2S ferredoxin